MKKMRAPQAIEADTEATRVLHPDSDTLPLYAAPSKSKRSKKVTQTLEEDEEEQEDYLDADKL